MRLFIIGNTHDDKGTQLEELTAAILKECGYEFIRRNSIEAGGNEIDVKAKRTYELASIQKEIPVVCECKAKNDPISITDWLKFVGKVSIDRMSNAQTEGIMIALSGAYGTVYDSYEALPDKSYLHLIAHDQLIKLICRHFKLKDAESIRDYFRNKTTKPIEHVDLLYYEKQVWWVVSFVHEEFTVVNDNLDTVEEKYLDDFLDRLAKYTVFKKANYVDVQKEEAAKLMEGLVKKSVVYLLMGKGGMALADVLEETRKFDYLKDIGKEEIEKLIEECEYIKKDGDKIELKNAHEIDIVGFYQWYDSAPMIIDGIATEYYVKNINDELLDAIVRIQENLEIPEDKWDDCLYIMTLSPGALMYALKPDEVVTNSRKMGGGAIPTVSKFHVSYFMNQLALCLLKDLQDPRFSTFYCRKFCLNDYSIETEMSLRFVEKSFNKKISYNSYVSFLNANGQTVPLLLFEKPEDGKGENDIAEREQC
ncbi:MAG: hypothetical protein II934_02595 [Prevotella sp.]|nr:hypothetical protein [Prevotella sp.]